MASWSSPVGCQWKWVVKWNERKILSRNHESWGRVGRRFIGAFVVVFLMVCLFVLFLLELNFRWFHFCIKMRASILFVFFIRLILREKWTWGRAPKACRDFLRFSFQNHVLAKVESFTGFYRVLQSFVWFAKALLSFTWFYWVLPSFFSRFAKDLVGFTWFYWVYLVLLGFT